MHERTLIERFISWIGSVPSIIFHTCIFAAFLVLTLSNLFPRDLVLLVWNTIVSLEAIYLAIFIQFSVNRQSRELAEVSEDIDEIQEDIDEVQKDVDEIQEDIEEISEDVEDDEARDLRHAVSLESLTNDVKRVLADLEALKSEK